jgi:hypothetical protein
MRERKLGTCNASTQAGYHIQGFDKTGLNDERAIDRRGEIPSFIPTSEEMMMTDAIDVYLNTILTQQLGHMGVQSIPGVTETVVTDIRLRLQSVLSRWHDLRTRNTLLLLGREEGAFYEPRSAPLEIRAFVVVTVRNSLLEDLGIPGASLIPADVPEPEKPMQEADVQPITEAAIRYWQAIDLPSLRVLPPTVEDDPFGHLAKNAPHAWHVLSTLANARERTITFAPCQAPRPSLPKATVEHDREERSVVLSGITPEFDTLMVSSLRAIRNGRLQYLYSDSWKWLTRHPGKLYRALDFALAHGGTVVTQNYLLTATRACARRGFARPAHTVDEFYAKFHDSRLLNGLELPHQSVLAYLAEELGNW